jgi:hypothetical protein
MKTEWFGYVTEMSNNSVARVAADMERCKKSCTGILRIRFWRPEVGEDKVEIN